MLTNYYSPDKMSKKKAEIDRTFTILNHEYCIKEIGSTGFDNTFLAGIATQQYLDYIVSKGLLDLKGKRVIELASGFGALSVGLAMCGAHVISGEIPPCVPNLQQSADINKERISSAGGSMKVIEYSWGDPVDICELPCDYVFMSEVVYKAELFDLQVASYKAICEENIKKCGKAPPFYIGHESRSFEEIEFFEKMREIFDMKMLPLDDMPQKYEDDISIFYCEFLQK